LREAGYYCLNGFGTKEQGYQTKFDYNFTEPTLAQPLPAWDAVSGHYPPKRPAHWNDRAPGQPFFAQIGFFITHSSQYGQRYLGSRPGVVPLTRIQESDRQDWRAINVPAYHPGLDGVKALWAEYYECITEMDCQVGELLRELERDGLAKETIVFFFGDNGMGVPGGKSWLWNEGLNVPLIVRVPESFRHLFHSAPGSVTDQIVSFEDFAPTVLRLAGVPIPPHMQGRAFDGKPGATQRRYAYGIRDRHDHSYDLIRTVRDKQYHYNRNFMPHFDWLHVFYMWKHAPRMMGEWLEEARAGRLVGRQSCFFRSSKPMEELYDMEHDPAQMNNLADDPAYADMLRQLRGECEEWMIRSGDLGLLSEYEMHERAGRGTPYEVGQNPQTNPVRRLLSAAWSANLRDARELPRLVGLLRDEDAAIRRWGAIGLAALREQAAPAKEELIRALGDDSPDVRLAAAGSLCWLGEADRAMPTIVEGVGHESGYVTMTALWVLDSIGEAARAALPVLREKEIRVRPEEAYMLHNNNDQYLRPMVDLLTDKLDPAIPRRSDIYREVDLKATREKYYGPDVAVDRE
jgi:hypothetical protein